MKYFKKLESERLYLSPINLLDAEIYTKWLNDPVVAKNIGHLASIFTIDGEIKALSGLEHTLSIVLKDKDELIGNCSFNKLDQRNRTAQIGIFIGEEEQRNHGYGTEAITLLLNYGFDFLNLHTVLLTVLSFNEHARECYLKLGFKVVGIMREVVFSDGKYYDRIIMELNELEWREKNEK